MRKKLLFTYLSIFLMVFLLFLITSDLKAENSAENLEQRMKLIHASQRLEELNENPTRMSYGLILTDFGVESEKEINFGIKFEMDFPSSKNKWNFVLESIYLKKEKDVAAFLSFKRSFVNVNYIPYLGAGIELTEKANYQIFSGLNIMNNFYIEGKIINEKGEFKDSDIYSALGYQINF